MTPRRGLPILVRSQVPSWEGWGALTAPRRPPARLELIPALTFLWLFMSRPFSLRSFTNVLRDEKAPGTATGEQEFGKAFNFQLLQTKREEGEEREDRENKGRTEEEGRREGGERMRRKKEKEGKEGVEREREALSAGEGGKTDSGGGRWGQRATIRPREERETEGHGEERDREVAERMNGEGGQTEEKVDREGRHGDTARGREGNSQRED